MTAKDAFFKKVEQNNEAQNTSEARVRADIQTYRTRVFELSKDIEQWLHGSSVQFSRTDALLSDPTVTYSGGNNADGRYNMTQIRLTNGEKYAVLIAEGLYYVGSTGCVKLTITNPRRAPSQVKFSLFMRVNGQQEEGWTVTRDGQKSPQGTLLSEETFFEIIEALA